jgi:hypothetical protein
LFEITERISPSNFQRQSSHEETDPFRNNWHMHGGRKAMKMPPFLPLINYLRFRLHVEIVYTWQI